MDEGNVIHKMTCCNCQDSLELKHQNADKYEEKPKILDIFNAEAAPRVRVRRTKKHVSIIICDTAFLKQKPPLCQTESAFPVVYRRWYSRTKYGWMSG